MRKLLIALMLSAIVMSVNGQDMVGHRGSLWGLENTREAFLNGIYKGYEALECDIRTTKDGQFVICHDEDFVRLGGDSTTVVRDMTMEEILSIPLRQKRRDGKTYYGNALPLSDFLDMCRQYDRVPVVEIKWSSNIFSSFSDPDNNHCYDGVPALMSMIAEKGLSDKAIILTSMKGVLDNIRKNYPDAQLQLLSRENWRQHVEWCFERNISIDVANGGEGFEDTEERVKTFHDKGVKVNVWTIDDPEKFEYLQRAGVDMITTNKLTK